jgi:hypothetical protein
MPPWFVPPHIPVVVPVLSAAHGAGTGGSIGFVSLLALRAIARYRCSNHIPDRTRGTLPDLRPGLHRAPRLRLLPMHPAVNTTAPKSRIFLMRCCTAVGKCIKIAMSGPATPGPRFLSRRSAEQQALRLSVGKKEQVCHTSPGPSGFERWCTHRIPGYHDRRVSHSRCAGVELQLK